MSSPLIVAERRTFDLIGEETGGGIGTAGGLSTPDELDSVSLPDPPPPPPPPPPSEVKDRLWVVGINIPIIDHRDCIDSYNIHRYYYHSVNIDRYYHHSQDRYYASLNIYRV